MSEPRLIVETVLSSPFEENTYIAHLDGSPNCVVIDPGLEPDKIIEMLARQQLLPAAILNTHGHSDHIAGNAALKQRWPDCPLMIGQGDDSKLTDPVANLSANYGINLISPTANRTLREGEVLDLAGIRLEVLETPGHSSGHIVFVTQGHDPTHVFGGDVLFAGSVGRTDFPDSSTDDLVRSIREKLFVLPDSTIVWPGHGPSTTIGREKFDNPFVGNQ